MAVLRNLSAHRRRSLLPVLLACVCAFASSMSAQTAGTGTGAAGGTIIDYTDAVLGGASVTISSPALMGTRTAISDARGFYRFPALPPGDYTFVFALPGFRTVRREGVRLAAGVTVTVDAKLDLAAVQQDVLVDRQCPAVEKQSTATVIHFDTTQLENLPGARSLSSLLAASPAVHVNRFDVGGNVAALGVNTIAFGTAGNNRPLVEGIDTTGVMATGFAFDYGSFDEVSIHTAAHGAEWPKPGVQTQIIVKSGGNRYRGSFYADYQNRSWQAANIDDEQIERGAPRGGTLLPRDANRLWNYHDVNADLGGYIRRDAVWWYSSFRDQEVAAWQINFSSAPHRTRVSNLTGKGTVQLSENHMLIAYGQAGRNHQPHRLDPSGLTGLSAANALNDAEATTEQRALGWILKAEWNAVLDDTAFVELRTGQFGANRPERPNGTSPRFEDVATLRVRGGHRHFQSNLRREQLFGSISYFKNTWLGNHHFKGGGEMYRTLQADIWHEGYPGDVLHVLRNDLPQEVYLLQAPSHSRAGFYAYAAYVSDSWRIADRVTVNLGGRFDRFRIFLPEQTHPAGRFNPIAQTFSAVANVIDWNVFTPRLGLIADLGGGRPTLVKINYGRYSANPGVETGFNANPNSSQWWRRHTWSDLDGNGVWGPGEEGALVESRGGSAVESIDPALDLPYVQELAGWVERELPGDFAIRAGLVWRTERQHFMRQNAQQPFAAFAVPVDIRDPGPDGILSTADDGPLIAGRALSPEHVGLSSNILRNVPNSDSHYRTWDFTATRRFNGRWSLSGGFAHTTSRDHASSYAGQPIRQNLYPLTPNDLINTGARGTHEFTVWTAKVHGTYQAPWGFRITPLVRHQSGQPFARTFTTPLNYGSNIRILAEPVGTRRMDHLTIVDARVERGFDLPFERRFALFIDVFNIFNANPEQNISWSSGTSFLRPLNIVAPRIARLGVKVGW